MLSIPDLKNTETGTGEKVNPLILFLFLLIMNTLTSPTRAYKRMDWYRIASRVISVIYAVHVLSYLTVSYLFVSSIVVNLNTSE